MATWFALVIGARSEYQGSDSGRWFGSQV